MLNREILAIFDYILKLKIMKTRLCKLLMVSLVAVLALGTTGCTKEYYTDEYITEEYYEGAFVLRKYYQPTSSNWTWDSNLRCFVYYEAIPELTQEIYDDGAMTATVFVDPGTTDEVQHILPFVHTYEVPKTGGGTTIYTETISCTFKPGGVWFAIQASDLVEDPTVLFDYDFKVAIFW